ncbi:hypothetical protein BDQ17DRAFT_1358312 [Cyathus striatus]|nr:hypothetical protein BDQ17DRAFT_1358312 [Cyathus striatus]
MPSFNTQTTIQEIATAYPGAIEGRTYLVTGATSGLGLAFAKFVAQHGAGTVVLTGRSEEKLAKASEEIKATASPQAIIKTLVFDLESRDSVRRAAEKITSGSLGIPKIDVLLNNGGILGTPFKKIDGYESQLYCNHISHFLFTNLILSHVTSPGGRIISVSSVAHGISPVRFDDINFKDGEVYNKFVAYGQSKTANILFAIGLNKRLYEKRGIQSFAVHPGSIEGTGLTKHLDLVAEGIKDEDGNLKNQAIELISIDRGIATYLYAALSPELEGKGGSYLTESQIKDTAYPMTEEDANKLWEFSNNILGTKF